MEKRNNNNKNSTQTKWIAKMALKNEIVVCFRLRSNQPRIFLEFNKTGSFWDGFQFKFAIAIRHCLVVLAVNVYMNWAPLSFTIYFYLSVGKFVGAFLHKSIVSFVAAKECFANLCNLDWKARRSHCHILLHSESSFGHSVRTPCKPAIADPTTAIICRSHFKCTVTGEQISTRFWECLLKTVSSVSCSSGLCIDKWMNDWSQTFDFFFSVGDHAWKQPHERIFISPSQRGYESINRKNIFFRMFKKRPHDAALN